MFGYPDETLSLVFDILLHKHLIRMFATGERGARVVLFFTVLKFAISQSEAVSTLLISRDIKLLT